MKIIRIANFTGVDVTLNCWLPSNANDMDFIYNYIDFAKKVNANAICFRKDIGNLEPMPVEATLGKTKYRNECPVCLSYTRFIAGLPVHWKFSVQEPSLEYGRIYELIYQRNGKLTIDWKGDVPC